MKSLAKALNVLCAFNGNARDLGVKDICEQTGMQKSQVSKILHVFRDYKILDQNPVSRRYSVGQRAFSIGSNFVNNHVLSQVSLPIVRGLVQETGHSVAISIFDQDVVHLLAVEGPLFLDARWRVGRVQQFHVSATARVLLAFRLRQEVETLIDRDGLPKLTERTLTEPEAFLDYIAQIPERGYDFSRSEGAIGLGALAVPIFGEGQEVIASIGMIFPETHVASDQESHYIALLHNGARQLSVRLGASIYPYGGVGPHGAQSAPPQDASS